jgi:haloacetate dehalogenase
VQLITAHSFRPWLVISRGDDRPGFDALACGRPGACTTHRLALTIRARRRGDAGILPTLTTTRTSPAPSQCHAIGFFFIQPFDIPERLIGADSDYFLEKIFDRIGRKGVIDPRAMECYARAFRNPARLHAMMEDYRAGTSIDLEHDRADRSRKLSCPAMVLWGEKGVVGRNFDVLSVWRDC